jgi:hypothetical protein
MTLASLSYRLMFDRLPATLPTPHPTMKCTVSAKCLLLNLWVATVLSQDAVPVTQDLSISNNAAVQLEKDSEPQFVGSPGCNDSEEDSIIGNAQLVPVEQQSHIDITRNFTHEKEMASTTDGECGSASLAGGRPTNGAAKSKPGEEYAVPDKSSLAVFLEAVVVAALVFLVIG